MVHSDDNLGSDGKNDWHGSCVASKAMGKWNGISQFIEKIILKASLTLDDMVWAFSRALDDIIANDRQGKSVVIFAATSSNSESISTAKYPWTLIHSTMRDMFDADVLVVVPAGNYAEDPTHDKDVDTMPARWAELCISTDRGRRCTQSR